MSAKSAAVIRLVTMKSATLVGALPELTMLRTYVAAAPAPSPFPVISCRKVRWGEIAGLLLDALADHVERERRDARRLLLEHLLDGLLVVLHERLVVQADLLQVLRDRALDAPRDDLG